MQQNGGNVNRESGVRTGQGFWTGVCYRLALYRAVPGTNHLVRAHVDILTALVDWLVRSEMAEKSLGRGRGLILGGRIIGTYPEGEAGADCGDENGSEDNESTLHGLAPDWWKLLGTYPGIALT